MLAAISLLCDDEHLANEQRLLPHMLCAACTTTLCIPIAGRTFKIVALEFMLQDH